MPVFTVEVRDRDTFLLRSFSVRTETEEEALETAGAQRDDIVSARKISGIDGSWQELSYPKKPKLRGLRDFYRTMARSISAGSKPMKALRQTLVVCTDPALRSATAKVLKGLREDGLRLTEAFAAQTDCFSERDCAVIDVGEKGGRLDEVFHRLARDSEGDVKMAAKLVSMFLEPVIILVMAVVTLYVIADQMVPVMEEMFVEFNAEIPALSKVVMTGSKFVRSSPLIPLAAIALPILCLVKWKAIYAKKWVQETLWKAKPLQTFIVKIEVSRAFRSLALLMACSTPIQDAFRLTIKTIGHCQVKDGFTQILGDITGEAAKTPLEAFLRARVKFGSEGERIAGYIDLGSETGSLSETIESVANDYAEDVEEAIGRAEKIIKPVLFILLGGVVALVLAGMYFPFLDLAKAIISPEGRS
jgi:type IV pilus assembly protein PilC